MGQIDNDMAAIEADGNLDKAEKKRARGNVKKQALIDFVQGNLPFTLPLSGQRSVEFLTASVSDTPTGQCMWTATGIFKINGVVQPFDWPWIVINPPMLRRSTQGQSDSERIVDGVTHFYKEDPWTVLKNLADRVFV